MTARHTRAGAIDSAIRKRHAARSDSWRCYLAFATPKKLCDYFDLGISSIKPMEYK